MKKSRKQTKRGTVPGDEEAADDSHLIINTVGGGQIDVQTMKYRGKTWTLSCSINEPPTIEDDEPDEPLVTLSQTEIDDYKKIIGKYVGQIPDKLNGAKKQKALPDDGAGARAGDDLKKFFEKYVGKIPDRLNDAKKQKVLPDDRAGAGSGESKSGPEATEEVGLCEEFDEYPRGKIYYQGISKVRCSYCFGKWHRPLTIEPPPELINVPVPKPGWFVACRCCLQTHFEEKTADCANCGSAVKCVLQKSCGVCIDVGHYDNTDKECKFYGKELPVKKYPFRRQPRSKKKLAEKEKELAAEDTVVPGVAASIASPQAKGKRKVADDFVPRRSLRIRGSSSGC